MKCMQKAKERLKSLSLMFKKIQFAKLDYHNHEITNCRVKMKYTEKSEKTIMMMKLIGVNSVKQ